MNKDMLSLRFPETKDFRFNEAIKTLRTNIQFSGSRVKTIIVTSVAPNDGKSIISLMVGKAFAESGKKTLYVDADIRNSVTVNRYGIEGERVGLSQALSGQIPFAEVVYETENPNLHVVLAGPYSPSPTELFEDEMCGKFFRYLNDEGQYDMIIIDTPPLGTVIDAAVLCRYADGITVVAASEETTRRTLSRVMEQIDRTGIRFLGIILNKVRMNKGGYGKYGYGKYGGAPN